MAFFIHYILLQMKAVAGMKMSYSLQQAINLSRKTIIRGFRQDETHSALCSHLFTMIRGNRQHRRAFLISLLNLFDDSAVSHNLLFSCLYYLLAGSEKVCFFLFYFPHRVLLETVGSRDSFLLPPVYNMLHWGVCNPLNLLRVASDFPHVTIK